MNWRIDKLNATQEVVDRQFCRACKAVVTTTIQLRFDCNSTAIRPLDELLPVWGLLNRGLNKCISQCDCG